MTPAHTASKWQEVVGTCMSEKCTFKLLCLVKLIPKMITDRTNKPFTLFAEVHRDLLWDSLGDVHLSAQTSHTHVGGVGRDGGATGTTQAEEEICFWSITMTELYVSFTVALVYSTCKILLHKFRLTCCPGC